ncbi:DUF47 domain-containing protein [Amycolatopsis sp. NPDC059657]|uniref:DUF47 domain-containing protein n=1 Tax=Amycolatopsis sp. NPDC059657 TaxID=3346899 RepID=UPI00366E5745
MKLPTAWFLPKNPDVLGLLRAQATTVGEAITALDSFSVTAAADLRHALIRQADQRREVLMAVREAFSTPLEAEDLFELAERLSEIAEAAYMLVREADLSHTGPDEHLAAMLAAISIAYTELITAMDKLPHGAAAGVADRVVPVLITADHAYRRAIAALENEPDIRREVRLRELYRRTEHLAGAVGRLAHRIWYAVCKIS